MSSIIRALLKNFSSDPENENLKKELEQKDEEIETLKRQIETLKFETEDKNSSNQIIRKEQHDQEQVLDPDHEIAVYMDSYGPMRTGPMIVDDLNEYMRSRSIHLRFRLFTEQEPAPPSKLCLYVVFSIGSRIEGNYNTKERDAIAQYHKSTLFLLLKSGTDISKKCRGDDQVPSFYINDRGDEIPTMIPVGYDSISERLKMNETTENNLNELWDIIKNQSK
eukprot:gb/GECH01012200.1/.p1 GENE.gb/GECH01012200.1/~~gb/GECH01012200.1/.p1  ORF type:complete len:222 (+),score=64.65 gb/GECH01012200.1/:1-666(+)